MSVTPFDVTASDTSGGLRVLEVKGELDLETTPALERAIEQTESFAGRHLLFDFSDCAFIDSTGVALLVKTWRRFQNGDPGQQSAQMAICCPPTQVRKVIEVTGLTASIAVYETRADAERELEARQPG